MNEKKMNLVVLEMCKVSKYVEFCSYKLES